MEKKSDKIDYSIIWKKIHGILSTEEEKEFEEWIGGNDWNRDFYENVKKNEDSVYRDEDISELSNFAWEKLENKLNPNNPTKGIRVLLIASSIAASILLLFGIYWLFGEITPNVEQDFQTQDFTAPGVEKAILVLEDGTSYDLSEGNPINLNQGGTTIKSSGSSISYEKGRGSSERVPNNKLIIPRGGQFQLTLADGTKVWLNSESSITFPAEFYGDIRKVELSGEAYFEVMENREQPFQVVSAGQVVQVLGTSFNIHSYPEEPQVQTTLIEGSVHVYLETDPSSSEILKPSQQSVWIKAEQRIQTRQVNIEEYISWKNGWFFFNDKPLEKIMMDLSRWYDVDVEFDNADSKQIQFTGKIPRYENLKEVLSLLEKTKEVEFIQERRKIIVK